MVKTVVIVENIKDSKKFELNILNHQDMYITAKKDNLRTNISEKLHIKLAKNGLYKNIDSAFSNINNRFAIHRLVCCLFANILNLDVHHINKNPRINNILNLMPVTKKVHNLLDNDENYIELAKDYQKSFKDKIFTPKKQTLASNDDLILEILKLKEQGLCVKEVYKKINKKIGKTKIYEIFKYFYYTKEFLKWLEIQDEKQVPELDENFNVRWEKVLDFESL